MLTDIVAPVYQPPPLPCLTTDEARTTAESARRELAEAEADLDRFRAYHELTAGVEQSDRAVFDRLAALKEEKVTLQAELERALAQAEAEKAEREKDLVAHQRGHCRFLTRDEIRAATAGGDCP